MSTLEFMSNGRDMQVLTELDDVRARAQYRARFVRGEWFANQTLGHPFLTELFGRRFDHGLIAEAFAALIARVEGVESVAVTSTEFDPDQTILHIGMHLETPFGPTDLEVDVG